MGITERIDAITGLPQNLTDVAPIPKSVKIELTGRCNFSCSFCARSQQLRDQGDMDRKLYERLLIEMRDLGVEEIGLFYLGESMLLPWLHEAVHFAKHVAKYPYVFLTTNGSLASPRRVRQLIAAGLDSLKFSLNYADPNQFEQIAHMPARLFPRILQNIRLAQPIRDQILHDLGHHCGLYASYIQYDGQQGERMRAVVSEVAPFVDEVYALPLYSQASLTEEEQARRGWSTTAGNRGRIGALREPLPCWAVFQEGHITFDGKLSACCFDHDGRFDMGDLTKQSFVDAWNSPKFQSLRHAHIRRDVSGTACERCVAYS